MSISKEIVEALAGHAMSDEDFLSDLLVCEGEEELRDLLSDKGIGTEDIKELVDIINLSPSKELLEMDLRSKDMLRAIEEDWKTKMTGAVFSGIC
jgi:hypothetical protein